MTPNDVITIDIDWKLPKGWAGRQIVEIPPGTTVDELLAAIGFDGVDFEEVLMVFNGHTIVAGDKLEKDGRLQLIPLLCGG